MKIICIGRNYVNHAKELGNAIPTEPVFFMKPDTALLKEGDFYHPDFSNDIHHEIEIVVRINKVGKNIEEQFAHKYYNEISLGIDFTARDLQEKCKEKGLPWEKAKAFDNSAPISNTWLNVGDLKLETLNFKLLKNGTEVQTGNTSDMIFSVDKLIAYVSKFVTLKVGDLIFTGTPEGVGKVSVGDHLEGFVEEKKILDFRVK
ncbi:MAG: fumarylacetoacetate hydrolase family protein [Bacteroidia bacterium]